MYRRVSQIPPRAAEDLLAESSKCPLLAFSRALASQPTHATLPRQLILGTPRSFTMNGSSRRPSMSLHLWLPEDCFMSFDVPLYARSSLCFATISTPSFPRLRVYSRADQSQLQFAWRFGGDAAGFSRGLRSFRPEEHVEANLTIGALVGR